MDCDSGYRSINRCAAPFGFIAFIIFALFPLTTCNIKKPADILFINAKVYTVDSDFRVVNSIVIKDGKILFSGDVADAKSKYDAKKTIDLQAKFVYPGLTDAHAHFYHYALDMLTADLTGCTSWQEVLDKVKQHANEHPNGPLVGRGWDQNKWAVKDFPDRKKLDELFPDRVVMLTRIDGHAMIVNQKALDPCRYKRYDKS